MPVTRQELNDFHQFAVQRFEQGAEADSLQELLDLWLSENPGDEQLQEDVLAVKAAIADLEGGDRGIPADEHLRQIRAKHNLPAER